MSPPPPPPLCLFLLTRHLQIILNRTRTDWQEQPGLTTELCFLTDIKISNIMLWVLARLHPALENMQKHNKDEMSDHNKLLDLSQANNDPTIDNKR